MKKIFAWFVLLGLLLTLFGVIPTSAEEGPVLRVSADGDLVEVGDEIEVTVTLGPVREMGTMAFKLEIPAGLAYVPGSGQPAEGLAARLGFDSVLFTEASLLLNGYASRADYTSDTETVLMTFRVRVTGSFGASCEITLSHLEFYSCRTWQNHTEEYRVVPAVLRSPHTHTYERTVQTQASCEADGLAVYTCICGNTYTEIIPPTGHKPTPVPATAPTCTEPGLTDGTRCADCGIVLTGQTAVSSVGHDFGDWSVTQEPTEAAEGLRQRVCRICGDTETMTIERLPAEETLPPETQPPEERPTKTQASETQVPQTEADTEEPQTSPAESDTPAEQGTDEPPELVTADETGQTAAASTEGTAETNRKASAPGCTSSTALAAAALIPMLFLLTKKKKPESPDD